MTVPRQAPFQPTLTLIVGTAMVLVGCGPMVGPDYEPPAAPVTEEWIDPAWRAERDESDLSRWWESFEDPALDRLVDLAYRQNLTLEIAGLRVIEAQARRALAIGSLFPQRQEMTGAYIRQRLGENTATSSPLLDGSFDTWSLAALDAAWEIDLWGKFRRGIESADASLIGSVYGYEDVLVSLIAEVAGAYVQIRILDEQLAVARSNRDVQAQGLEIAAARFEFGAVTELDVAQSRAQLRDTEAAIPLLEAGLRPAQNTLCVLLGIPPRDLGDLLGEAAEIPFAEPEILLGIPADLLRRRPDVRRAEREVATQSARIGIAAADLYPSFQLVGSIGFEAEDLADLFTGDSFTAFGGPSFRWNILNYGRIRNAVRVEDALLQQRIVSYEETVLRAQQEVEDAMAAHVGARRSALSLADAAAAARRAVELSELQYKEGAVDFNTVLNTQQALLQAEAGLVRTRGDVALSLVALYRALGGGWQKRLGGEFVSDRTEREMRARTNWAGLLDPTEQVRDVERAQTGTESETGWWRWRWWRPQW